MTLTFHEEIDSSGFPQNCIAYDEATSEGYASLFDWPDSQVTWVALPREWIDIYTRPITEEMARVIHPQLFTRIDADASLD